VQQSLAALLGVVVLSKLLLGRPPRLVVSIPLDSRFKPDLEVRVRRRPAKFIAKLCGIDRISEVVTRSILDVFIRVIRETERAKEGLDHFAVASFAIGTDQVGLSQTSSV